ncbi:hypothetical protein LTS08_000959 [Lithohypha guttulata]|uniref:uncharacterized protein n=1 Tax=Lithohypha guttulata TaxID=1690604 RepID=UPI002DE02E87|nr:hypothetical protein LTS08_000959 [Lithohypha guttulata]
MSLNILILGAGELGSAILDALLQHPAYHPSGVTIAVAIRAETLDSLDKGVSSPRIESLQAYRAKGITFTSADLVEHSEQKLSELFSRHNCVVHAGAMTLPEGTQLKVTKAVLAAKVDLYIPWQWGRSGGMGLFSEQCDVRDLLRSQNHTRWYIVSCGVFMSFLFEDFWGVVVRSNQGRITVVRALGGWDHLITATTVEDIARCNAELLLRDTSTNHRNRTIYIAGDTMTYDEFADLVERTVGHTIERELWSTEYLKSKSSEEPENKLLKYRVVFSEDKGLAWSKEDTYITSKGIGMEGIEAYMRRMNMQ